MICNLHGYTQRLFMIKVSKMPLLRRHVGAFSTSPLLLCQKQEGAREAVQLSKNLPLSGIATFPLSREQ